jgi:hypothetical protein
MVARRQAGGALASGGSCWRQCQGGPGWIALVTAGRHRQPRACLDAQLPLPGCTWPARLPSLPPADLPSLPGRDVNPCCCPNALRSLTVGSAAFSSGGVRSRVSKRRGPAARVALGRAVVRAIAFCRGRVTGYAAVARAPRVRPAVASATSRSRAGEQEQRSAACETWNWVAPARCGPTGPSPPYVRWAGRGPSRALPGSCRCVACSGERGCVMLRASVLPPSAEVPAGRRPAVPTSTPPCLPAPHRSRHLCRRRAPARPCAAPQSAAAPRAQATAAASRTGAATARSPASWPAPRPRRQQGGSHRTSAPGGSHRPSHT